MSSAEPRGCYCPTCGTATLIPEGLQAGVATLCSGCEEPIRFPGGAALWFDKLSELTMDTPTLMQIRQMRAELRHQKAVH